MPESLRSFFRWLKTRYGNKPVMVQTGTHPYRAAPQEVLPSTEFLVLIWRMAMEGAAKISSPFFRYWKPILGWAFVISMLGLGGYGIVFCAKEQALAEAQKKTMKATLFIVSERYWACIHKVVDCGFYPKDDPYDPSKVVQCKPSFTTTGAGFDEPHCPEGDMIQRYFVLQTEGRSSEKLLVTNFAYDNHNVGSLIMRKCNVSECDDSDTSEALRPVRADHVIPAADAPPPPPPSASSVSASDPRGVNRFSLLPTKH